MSAQNLKQAAQKETSGQSPGSALIGSGKKLKFKSNTTGENMGGFMTVDSGAIQTTYVPINGFTTVDIGCERGNNSYNMVTCMEAPHSQQYMQLFDGLWNNREKMQDVTDVVLENISTAYAENSPEFIYFMTLYQCSVNFWMISLKMNCRTRLLVSSRAKSGVCFMISSGMPCLPSSTNWKSTTAAFLPIALVLVKHSLLLQL